jgi:hypothetical protein
LEPKKISLLADSIRSRIGPLSHAINYNGRHVSDRLVIAELENLIRISNSTFPGHSDYFGGVEQEITAGNIPLTKVIEVLDFISELAWRSTKVPNAV